MPKIIVMACSLRGHLRPNVRLAQHIATLPGMEVYFITDLGAPPDSLPKPPVKVLLPTEDQVSVKAIEDMEQLFADIAVHPKTNRMKWFVYVLSKLYFLSTSPADPQYTISRYYFENMCKYLFGQVRELKPTMLIMEAHFDYMQGVRPFAKKHDLKVVQVMSSGRPDLSYGSDAIKRLTNAFFPDVRNLKRLFPEFFKAMQAMNEIGGGEMKDYWGHRDFMTILVGCRGFVESPPSPYEFYTGPFIELPGMDEAPVPDHPAIDFINSAGDEPVVYVSFGTLVVIQPGLAKTLAYGLQKANCKVLWSIPEVQQSMLPAGLEAPKWCIQNFVPQTAVLRSEKVKCFMSHCGSNSTHESLSTGTPMICIPFYGDQIEWAESVTNYLKAGLTLDKSRSMSYAVTNAVTKVLTRQSFLQNAQAARDAISSECLSPEVPPGEMGVQAAGRLIQSILDGHDYLTPREKEAEEAKKKAEEAKEAKKNRCKHGCLSCEQVRALRCTIM